jgi:hypothetical protein
MKNLKRLSLLIAILAMPAYAHAQGMPASGASGGSMSGMNCPMMTDMHKDMSGMMTNIKGMMKEMGGMMEGMSDPAMKERMQKMHDNMGAMMAHMEKMDKGMGGMMGGSMMMDKGDSSPAKPASPAPEDHSAHHQGNQ